MRVREAPKRCKKLRGLIRLVRPVFDDYPRGNEALRDADRSLAPLRDSDVLLETYDGLVRMYSDQVDRAGTVFRAPASALISRRREALAPEAFDLGRRLLAESPDALIARGEAYSDARRDASKTERTQAA